MNIHINEKPMELAQKKNLAELLSELEINSSAIAVAVNGEVVHRDQWHHTLLRNNDSITLVQAVAGG